MGKQTANTTSCTVTPPAPTCPWPTEGESWVWDCHERRHVGVGRNRHLDERGGPVVGGQKQEEMNQ